MYAGSSSRSFEASRPRSCAATPAPGVSPAIASTVGKKSIEAMSASETSPAAILPGHHASRGVEIPPSYLVHRMRGRGGLTYIQKNKNRRRPGFFFC